MEVPTFLELQKRSEAQNEKKQSIRFGLALVINYLPRYPVDGQENFIKENYVFGDSRFYWQVCGSLNNQLQLWKGPFHSNPALDNREYSIFWHGNATTANSIPAPSVNCVHGLMNLLLYASYKHIPGFGASIEEILPK